MWLSVRADKDLRKKPTFSRLFLMTSDELHKRSSRIFMTGTLGL